MKLGSPVPDSDPGLRRWPTRAPGPTWALALLVVWGCQLVGSSGPPGPEAGRGPEEGTVRGVVYQGALTLDGGEIPAGLELIPTGGGRVRGALQTTDGLRADGSGRLRGRTLRLRLLYGGDCPGEIVLEGPWDQASGAYSGTAEAQDCTGRASGSFRFSASDSFRSSPSGSFRASPSGSFRAPASGSFRAPASGSFRAPASGSFRAAGDTGPLPR